MSTEPSSVVDELDGQTSAQLRDFAEELAEDYARYFNVDCLKESKKLQDKTDEYLEILEGFCNVLESIRKDSAICLGEHLPAIIDKSRRIQKLYELIDKIEAVVTVVKKTVDDMDEEVIKAEAVLGKPVIIRRLFNTLFGSSPKKTSTTSATPLQYSEPNIFNTSDYFVMSSELNHSDNLNFSGASDDDPDEELIVRSHRTKKKYADSADRIV